MIVLNDLYDYNLKIYQNTTAFKFSLDSILLAEFVKLKNKDKVLDLCTGNASIPLILTYYYQNMIVGFEIQKEIAELANDSIKYNNKEEQIEIINDNVLNVKNYFPGNNFDVIICNPPYYKASLTNQNNIKSIARHEVKIDLESVFKVVANSLKSNGTFYLVHIPERLEEILYFCEKYKIIAKKIQFIYTNKEKNANIVLVKCVKGANNGLKVCNPLMIERNISYQNIFRRKR